MTGVTAAAPAPYLEELWSRLPALCCIVVVGLPGTGKSLLVRELARAAAADGRESSLLQWDVSRESWDRSAVARERYPEVNGVTHEGVRVAMGAWVRAAVGNWFAAHSGGDGLLIVEAPHVGGRFSELSHVEADRTEAALAADETLFVIVAPTRQLHAQLRDQRGRDMEAAEANTGYEEKNAPPDLLDELTDSLREPARELGIPSDSAAGYDPDLYARLMSHVLRHRHTMVIHPDELVNVTGSVYLLGDRTDRIWARPAEVEGSLAFANSLSQSQLEQRTADWFRT